MLPSTPAVVETGTLYVFSYDASSSGPLAVSVQASAGDVTPPYQHYFTQTDPVGPSLQTFGHSFTATVNDSQVGIAFNITPVGDVGKTTVCFDNVALLAVD